MSSKSIVADLLKIGASYETSRGDGTLSFAILFNLRFFFFVASRIKFDSSIGPLIDFEILLLS